ncbi:MAG: DUF362 domain-containing protein [Candidatus Latescibacter sp.]|nr:DUF362 domain-containing protein [Candidatus Latescibacter sp.]
MKKFSRRTFLDHTAKGITGFPLFASSFNNSAQALEKPAGKVPVVVVQDDKALSGSVINQDTVQVMLDAALKSITGMESALEAWQSLFPGITRKSVIGIKVNCINDALSSHPKTAMAVAGALKRMQVEGSAFPEGNIIIWDRTVSELRRAGYTINTGTTGIRCFGTDQSGIGYSTINYNVAGSTQRLSRIITDMCDYLINLSVFKNHDMAGVTFSMKNHYGTCNNPGGLHGGYCDPYIAALNNLSPIRTKQVISICDALWGIVAGGPGGAPQVTPKSLIVSRDPVAHDAVCTQEIGNLGCKTLKIATHIATAAKAPYSLGIADLGQIEILRLQNPKLAVKEFESGETAPQVFRVFQNTPNPFNVETVISYRLFRPAAVKLDIYSIRGTIVRRLVDERQNAGLYRVNWDGRSKEGLPAASGIYFGRFLIDKHRGIVCMQLLK